MRIGVIGTGLMGSNLARCLHRRGYELVLYNRTKAKAEKLAEEIGGAVVDSPREVLERVDFVVLFVSGDDALIDIVFKPSGLVEVSREVLVVNASTITPMTSMFIHNVLSSKGLRYVEAPVYGSVSEARDCNLLSLVACSSELTDRVLEFTKLYSRDSIYVGEIPSASVLKLALNNIGLAVPALLAESLMLLESWRVDPELFREVAGKLWFGEVINRYWSRVFEEKPPRFKTWMAGKDYHYVASTLKYKKLPAHLSETISSMYMEASRNGYMDKDYPSITRYYLGLARRNIKETSEGSS